MPNCKLTKKAHSHILLHVFVFNFSEYITITSSEEALKMWEHNFIQEIKRKVVLPVIYLFSYIHLSPLYPYIAFDVLLTTVLSNK